MMTSHWLPRIGLFSLCLAVAGQVRAEEEGKWGRLAVEKVAAPPEALREYGQQPRNAVGGGGYLAVNPANGDIYIEVTHVSRARTAARPSLSLPTSFVAVSKLKRNRDLKN